MGCTSPSGLLFAYQFRLTGQQKKKTAKRTWQAQDCGRGLDREEEGPEGSRYPDAQPGTGQGSVS